MLTLGIHDGHTATACLFEDGRVIACISEERLNRQKEWAGFPAESIKRCLSIAGKSPEEIDAVGVCSLMPQIGHAGYESPGLHKRLFSHAARVLPKSLLQRAGNIDWLHRVAPILYRRRRSELRRSIADLGIRTQRITFYDHHLLHAATTYYTSWFKDEPTLVLTLDGSGDATCATVNVGRDGRIERKDQVFNYNSVCELYTRVTEHLGMKPMSHEYKVMGMAPYASRYGFEETLDVFRSYFQIDPSSPTRFVNNSGVWKWQMLSKFQHEIGRTRFDTVAGAVQEFFEEIVLDWVRNAIRRTGIGNVALSGGGFMNVKLNYRISCLPEVQRLFVFPSCGDESNPVGASILAALNAGFPHDAVEPLGMIDWGPSYTEDEIHDEIKRMLPGESVEMTYHDDPNQAVAELISEGNIVGRFVGRMEWGARALGNRSILADARRQEVIHRLNQAIKMRDFWMPFAPAILESHREKYINLRPDYPCPYMTIAPETKPIAWQEIPAGIHPFDKSTRSQVLDAAHHGSFHEMLKRYESITGIGGVLNTSFNLHGDPVVCSPRDAIYTFLNSGLDVLQLENFVVVRSAASSFLKSAIELRAAESRGLAHESAEASSVARPAAH